MPRLIRFICASILVVATPLLASAADLVPLKAAPAPAPFSWTGFYVGLSNGARVLDAGWTTSSITTPAGVMSPPAAFLSGVTPDPASPYRSTAFRFAGYAGYNWQATQQLVVGLEADIGWARNEKTNQRIPGTYTSFFPATVAITAPDSSNVKGSWDGSLRYRIGFLAAPSFLFYGTGGAAWQQLVVGEACMSSFICGGPTAFTVSTSTTKIGWTAGGGIESMLWQHWLARAEYRYSDFGHVDFSLPSPVSNRINGNIALKTHTATVGLAYKF